MREWRRRARRRLTFPGREPGEEVLVLKRRHWIILVKRMLGALSLGLLMAVMAWGASRFVARSATEQLILWVGLQVPTLALAAWLFLDWENDHFIVTNRRVIHIERVYLFFESRREATLDKVQDVTVYIPSFIANLLYYGDVNIETAGKTGRIRFESVHEPRHVQRVIFDYARLAGAPGLRDADERLRTPGRTEEGWRWVTPFSAPLWYMLYPRIPQGEDVIVWRKHWWILLQRIGLPTFVALALLCLWVVAPAFVPIPRVAIFAFAVMFALSILWLLWRLVDWHNDIYVLTPDHVIDIEKRPFLSEFRREANLAMIQDVSYTQPSFLSKLLDFGTVVLETAGVTGQLTFDNVPHPREVQRKVFERVGQVRAETQKQRAAQQREQMKAVLDELLLEIARERGLTGQEGQP